MKTINQCYRCFSLALILTCSTYAADDMPFDDLEAEVTNTSKGQSSASSTSPAKIPPKKKTQAAPKKKVDDDPLGDLEDDPFGEGESPQTAENPPAAKTEAQETPVEEDALTDIENPDEGVRDVLTPDKNLKQAEAAPEEPLIDEVPTALLETEVASTLDPSDQFHKIPLHPPMSDLNWKKFAGPSLSKAYRIRRGDTLWGISERLFGNPYLWPKVWQLNAQLGNPHNIDPGIELQFLAGNPQSAPALAMKTKDLGGVENSIDIPIIETFEKLSFLEQLESMIKLQTKSSEPPFQNFLVEDLPEEVSRIPKRLVDQPILYSENDVFDDDDLDDGEYSIVRGLSLAKPGKKKSTVAGYRLRWLGTLKVKDHKALISRAFIEIEPGDLIVNKDYSFQPLSLRKEVLGSDESSSIQLTSIEDGTMTIGAYGFRSLGIKFSSKEAGPTPGAILSAKTLDKDLGTIVLIHREGRYGTAWVFESSREIKKDDIIE